MHYRLRIFELNPGSEDGEYVLSRCGRLPAGSFVASDDGFEARIGVLWGSGRVHGGDTAGETPNTATLS